MGLLNDIKEDIRAITSDTNGFGVELTFTAPTGEVAVVAGLHTKHHMGFDVESGKDVNIKNAHCSVSEALLTEAGYPVRNAAGEVFLRDHQVQAVDSTGTLCKYVVAEWIPDETIGLILCILGDKE